MDITESMAVKNYNFVGDYLVVCLKECRGICERYSMYGKV